MRIKSRTKNFLAATFLRFSIPAIVLLLALSPAYHGCAPEIRLTQGTIPRPYPYEAPLLGPADIQLFRDETEIELVNHTAVSYTDFDLWLNERFLRRIASLPAGGSVRIQLVEFVSEFTEGFRAGGLLSNYRPDPIVKAEIQTEAGLVGLITIPVRER